MHCLTHPPALTPGLVNADLGATLPLLLSSSSSGGGAQPAGITTVAAFRHLFPNQPQGEQLPQGAPDAAPGHLVPVGPVPACGGIALPLSGLGTWALLSVAACSLASASGAAAAWQHHAASGLWTPQAAASLSVFIQVGGPRLQRAACRCIRSAAASLGRAYLPRTLLVSAIRVALLDRCAAAATTGGLAFLAGGSVDDALGAALQECVPGMGSSGDGKGEGGDDSPRYTAGPFSVDDWQACLAPFAAALAPLIIRDAASPMLRSAVHAAALTALRGGHSAEPGADAAMTTDALLARTSARACLDALRGAITPVAPDRRAALAEVLSAALLRAGGFGPTAPVTAQQAAKAPATTVDDAADPPPPPSTKRRRLRRAAAADGEGGAGNGDRAVPMSVDAGAPPAHTGSDIQAHVLATLLRLSPPQQQQQEMPGEGAAVPSPADVLTSLSSLSVLCTALATAPRDCAVVQAAAACVSSWCAWASADGQHLPPMTVRSAVLDAVLCLLCGTPGANSVPAARSVGTGIAASRPPSLEQLIVPQHLLCVVAWAPPTSAPAATETLDDANDSASACGSRTLACALALDNRDTLLAVMRKCVHHASLPPLRASAAAAAPCAVAQGLLSLSEALAELAPLAVDTHAGVCISLAQCLGGLASASAALAAGGSAMADAQSFAWRSGPSLVVAASASGGHLPKHSFGALDACVAALPPSTGQGALPLTGSGWRPFLERFWCSAVAPCAPAPPTSAPRPPCDEALAASVTSSAAILRHASPAHLAGAETLLTSLAGMAAHPGRAVRLAACASAHVLALPTVIAACYPIVKEADARELQLLGTYRSLFQPTAPSLPSQLTQGGEGDTQARQGSAHQSDARDTGLRTFASVGIALDSRNSDAVTLFCCVAALDDPNWAVRSAALAAVRALASARRAPSLRVFILAHKKVLAFVGEHLGRRPRLTAQLAGAMGMVPTRLVATELLPAALPAIVASCEESALVAAASALGRTPGELLADNVQYVMADLIERNVLYGQAHEAHTYNTTAFVQRVTGRSMTDLVGATREELIEVLLENVGADPDISTVDAGAKLRSVVHTLMVSFGQGGEGSSAGNPPDLAAFMQSHITALLKHTGDALVAASEVSGGAEDPTTGGPSAGTALDLAPPLTSSADAAMQPAAAALRSLRVLVALMEASVPQFAPKVLCLLSRVATSCGPHLRVHALHAAQDLARCMAQHAPKHLPLFAGPLLVLCLPWLTVSPGASHDASHTAAVELVTFLVLGTGIALKGHLSSLPTLPAIKSLAPVIAAIQAERGTLALHQRLDALAQGLRHESLAVRAIAAAEATREVRLCAPGAVADAFATHPTEANGFLAALLSCCTGDGRASAAQRAAHAAALSCLGELGAIDPARVSLLPTPPPRAFVPSDTVFGASLIENHVARLMRGAADPHTLDVAAYVCQEVLRYFKDAKPQPPAPSSAPATRGGGAGATASGAGRRSSASAAPGAAQQPQQVSDFDALWQTLRPETQELIAPCLNSKYFVTSQGVVAPAPGSAPLFSLRPELAYRRWLQLWCRGLIAFGSTSPRAGLFKAVTSILRFDIGTMLVLLPHLVLAAVCHGGTGARETVAAEIVAVLSEAAGVTDSGGGDFTGSLGAGVMPPAATGRSALAAQTVFTLLDQLTAWLADSRAARAAKQQQQQQHQQQQHQQQAAAVAAAKKPSSNAPMGGAVAAAAVNGTQAANGRGDADETAVSEFLKDIPLVLCAQAAASVGAAARALKYFEDHLRRRNKNLGLNNPASYHGANPANVPTSEAEVSFLGALYRQLEQPDALAALPKLRSVPSVADRVAQAEQGSDFAEALAFFEAAMHQEAPLPGPGTSLTDAEQGRLRCLWGLGQLGAVLRETAALLPVRPDSGDELCAAGAAAAWRLGHWDALHTYCVAAGVGQEGVQAAATGSIMAGGSAFGGPSEGGGALTLAAAMRAVHARDSASLEAAVRAGQEAALAPLAAAAMEGSYERAHPHLLRLHALHEVVAAADVLLTPGPGGSIGTSAQMGTFCALMDSRLGAVQPTLGAREPLLALRGAVLSLVFANPGGDGVAAARQGARRAALATAKLCRASGAHGAAQLAVLRAQGYGDNAVSRLEAAVEGARLLWDTGRGHRAVSDLQEALNAAIGTGPLPAGATQRVSTGGTAPMSQVRVIIKPSVQARATLLLARWAHETGQKQKSEVFELYGRITAAEPRWEAAYFYMAKYTDELLTDAKRRERVGIAPQAVNMAAQRALRAAAGAAGAGTGAHADVPERHTDYLVLTVRNYGLALRHGCKRIFQALPRMLTLWFDAPSLLEPPPGGPQSSPAAAAAWSSERRRRDKQVGDELRRTMVALLTDPHGKLSRTVWLTALPVLISRICHKDMDTAQCVKSLLADLAAANPAHVLWSLAMVSKSREAARRQAAAEVLATAKKSCSDKVVFAAFAALVDNLVKLCNYQPKDTNAKTFSLASELVALKRCMPVPVVLPVQRYLTASLPADGGVCDDGSHSPFDCGAPTLVEVLDDVDVMHSLQKPKKVTFRGSDGALCSFLAKPKDDLRKDLRMMEFVSLLNRTLAREPASRKRRLYLRSFAVLPLTEDCGLIEWVPHTTGLRLVLQDQYQRAGMFDRRTSTAEAKTIYEQGERSGRAPAETLRAVLRKYPPIFHRYFPEKFADPAAWFAARSGFAHTAAVWSMVGHIVGLGDRHGENILVDTSNGDVVHVDFSCLFDKGLELDKPEVVPFRLTQNMIDALGVAGPDGVFSSVCEITLGVLRQHRDALMSVLDTFVHDPLLEWTRAAAKQQQQQGGGAAHVAVALATGGEDLAKSLELLTRIRSRLEGVVVGVGAAPSLPLSTAGQARRLIEEAVNLDNLGRMYIWWMAWW